MEMIQIQELKYYIGARKLLDIEKLQVQAGENIGLVGKNGSGKSTLFNLLMKHIQPDVGSIVTKGSIELLPQLKESIGHKSGGEVAAEYVARGLAKSPSILLADEPTTNLDTQNIEWVEQQLKRFKGTLLLITHDRELLDHLCTTIWELEESKIKVYTGNYTQYMEQKDIEKREQQKNYEKFKQKEHQLEQAIQLKEQKAERATRKPKNISSSEARIKGVKTYFGVKQKKLYQNSKALQSRLDQLEKVEKPEEETPIQMDLPNERAFKNKTIIRAENLEGRVGEQLLWQPTTFFLKGGDKVGIIGPNGSGKTTFLKMLLADEHSNLYRSPSMKIGYFDQTINLLEDRKTILENVQKDSKQDETLIRTVLARLGFYANEVHKLVEFLSGGERVKVSLAKILVSECNTLILDEPTNYLDVYALEALEKLLAEYEGTILFVSHDRHFVEQIASKILSFKDKKLSLFEGDYTDYINQGEHTTRDLVEEKRSMLEMEMTSTLSKLSDPTLAEEEKTILDQKFQKLLNEKNQLMKQQKNNS